ncbi:MAG: DedA family protein [Myxococcaceae bacterium]
MDHLLENLLSSLHGPVAYAAVFGILLACGLGVPLPEDISLILGGYLAFKKQVELPMMMAVGFAGILAGDSLIYFAGRRVGTQVGTRGGFFARVVTPEKRARVEALFGKHGQKIVMIARFLPGVRAVTYFTAGSAKMPYWKFIAWDGLAALASAPLFVYLGYYFGAELDYLKHALKRGQTVVIVALALAAVSYFFYTRIRKKRLEEEAARAPVEPKPTAESFGSHQRPPLVGK